MTAVELAESATVLAWTQVHRSRPAAVLDAPYTVVHVREDGPGDGEAAAFNCPLIGDGPEPAIGDSVDLKIANWQLDDDHEFAGVVAHR